MKIISITEKNLKLYDHCLIKDKKASGYIAKSNWIKERLSEGLVIKRMIDENNNTTAFIEYIPIENAWRAVEGKKFLFIHCLFTYPKKYQNQGIASKLIKDCINDTKKMKKDGVAVVTSKNSFIADKRVFEKFSFVTIDELNNHELLVYKISKNANQPKFKDIKKAASKYKGLHLFYTDQCPSLAKPVSEIKETCKKNKIDIKIHYIKNATDAQNVPFVSGTFGIIYDGKTLAERCISNTRFLNIINKVMK